MTRQVIQLFPRNPWFGAVAAVLVSAFTLKAGVDAGALPKNAEEAQQKFIMQNYEAQKSLQEKLKAGRERYDLMLTNRARVLAGMAAQLELRQQIVGIPSESAATAYANETKTNTWAGTAIGVSVIVICFLSFRYYLHRRDLKETPVARR